VRALAILAALLGVVMIGVRIFAGVYVIYKTLTLVTTDPAQALVWAVLVVACAMPSAGSTSTS
jgi:hypothetical protein